MRDSDEAKGASRDSKQEADLMWQVERLQRQSDKLRDEREGLLRDMDLLKEALESAKDRGETCNNITVLTVHALPQLQAPMQMRSSASYNVEDPMAMSINGGNNEVQCSRCVHECRMIQQVVGSDTTGHGGYCSNW